MNKLKAAANSAFRMSQTTALPELGGEVVYNAPANEYWLGTFSQGYQKTDAGVVPSRAEWKPVESSGIASRIAETRNS